MLAKGAKTFNVPTLFTTAFAERQALIEEIQAVHPDQTPIDRTGLNSWDDERIRAWIKSNGQRRKLVMGGPLDRSLPYDCRCYRRLQPVFEVYIVTDASGGGSPEGHEARGPAHDPGGVPAL